VGGEVREPAAPCVASRNTYHAVRIHDAHATVSLTAPGVPSGSATLVKEHGRWRIDNY
jgi:hypothetical protein